MNSTQPQQHGYILLLTLVMVALVAAGTVGLTRTSLASATQAKRAESELQRRWATLSSRRVLLDEAPSLIESRWQHATEVDDLEAQADAIPVSLNRESFRVINRSIRLGEYAIEVRLADEQAKINVNTLLSEFDREEASRLIDTLVRAGSQHLVVDLQPLIDSDTPRGRGRIQTLERVFKGFDPEQVFGGSGYEVRTTSGGGDGTTSGGGAGGGGLDAVTCWGDGRLRLGLATDEALRVLLAPYIDTTRLERLLELRDERPDITVDQALRALSLGPTDATPVRRLLTDRSTCYSLWLTVRSEQRTWHELGILQPQGGTQERYLTYLW
jgi:hypothetical protein